MLGPGAARAGLTSLIRGARASALRPKALPPLFGPRSMGLRLARRSPATLA
jgi:hypothetical protein